MADRVESYVVRLARLRRTGVERAGAKGANLGELVGAGAPVPAGFVVTTEAYQAHLRHSGLEGRLPQLLAGAPDGSAVREALRRAEVPPGVVAQLSAAYADLVGDPARGAVAVRSSATAEDLPGMSFAGQHTTHLNVVGTDAVIEAVRDCWASLWNERAIRYRDRYGIAGARMAVVVQRMVPAEAAGVMVTANPVTGTRDEVVVDAGRGLGEAVVAGLVTPEHLVLDKRSLRRKSTRPGRQEVLVRPRPGGGTDTVPAPPTPGPVLRRRQLHRLARLATRTERHFGAPQDIEWAWYRGRAYLLQARPATALPAPPLTSRYSRTFAGLMAEVIPVRPYPLDLTTWLGALLEASATISRRLGLGARPLGSFAVGQDAVAVRLSPPVLHPTWRALLLPVRLREWTRREVTDAELAAAIDAPIRRLRQRDLASATWPQLLATLRAGCAVSPALLELRLRHLPDAVGLLWLWLALHLLGRADQLPTLVSGTAHKTAETGRALDALAARIRRDPPLAHLFSTVEPADLLPVLAQHHPQFLADLRDFLDRYGHRETVSPLLATQPTWRDAPQVVLGLLRAGAARQAPPPSGRPSWQVARDQLLTHPLLRFPPLRHAVLRWLAAARRAFHAREDSRFYLTEALPVVRASMLELGRRLQQVAALDQPEDVFHLTLDELDRVTTWPPPAALVADLRARVRRRAAARAALARTPLVDPASYEPPGGMREALVRGLPGSPGTGEGPARIIRDATEFGRLRPGDVLVTPYTNPAWTPLFAHAAAVVVDTGGVTSHAAIIAREYQIPAVMATVEGTRRLADGQRVRVDGTRGLVLPA